jgi:MEMO1 family protein
LFHVEKPAPISAAASYMIWGSGESATTVERASQRANIRRPAVAGLFYPGDQRRLATNVADLLAQATPSAAIVPKALIAPHAGYVYSGGVAAAAFATLRDSAPSVERVVLIGPAHYVAVRGIAIPKAAAFETPLGRVPVDRDALAAISDLPFVGEADGAHAPEHALEVELPFLQALLPAFAIVPLLVGNCSPQQAAEVLHRLWRGPETLIVVSSDLSHYHDYETARQLDAATAAAIERGDWEGLGPDQACGALAVAALLVEARRRGLAARRLALCNSGDTAGSRDRVVGYGAWTVAPV